MNPIFTIEKAPRPITKTLSSEILSLWESENAGISNLDERLAEIRYVARSEEGDLAGVCSCTVDQGIFNGLHFHAMRVLVASAFRQKLLAFELLAYLVEELSDNRHGKFKIGPVGVKVVIQNPIVAERGKVFCARTFQFPINKTPKKFLLSGFTPRFHPEYCHYFADDSAESQAAVERWATTRDALGSDAIVRPLSQNPLDGTRREVLAFLQQEAIAEQPVRHQQTLSNRQVYTLSSNDQLIAVCELVPRLIREINADLFGIHLTVSAAMHDVDVMSLFAREIYAKLDGTRSDLPKGVVGLFMVYTGRTGLPALCPVTGFHLHGVDMQGKELRVRYFDDIEVDVPQ